jgi:K+-transporting ATPase c subunit
MFYGCNKCGVRVPRDLIDQNHKCNPADIKKFKEQNHSTKASQVFLEAINQSNSSLDSKIQTDEIKKLKH